MKISTRQDVTLLKNQWIIGDRIDLNFNALAGIGQSIPAGTMYLWHTTKTVGVLNLAAIPVRGKNFTAFQQCSDVGRDVLLALVGSDGMNSLIKRHCTAL